MLQVITSAVQKAIFCPHTRTHAPDDVYTKQNVPNPPCICSSRRLYWRREIWQIDGTWMRQGNKHPLKCCVCVGICLCCTALFGVPFNWAARHWSLCKQKCYYQGIPGYLHIQTLKYTHTHTQAQLRPVINIQPAATCWQLKAALLWLLIIAPPWFYLWR